MPAQATNVQLDTDDAVDLQAAVVHAIQSSPSGSTVHVELDPDTAGKLKDALKTGLAGAAALVVGDDNPA